MAKERVYCIKTYKYLFTEFEKGRWYNVALNGYPFDMILESEEQFFGTIALSKEVFDEYFLTEKQVRKLKLEKLDGKA